VFLLGRHGQAGQTNAGRQQVSAKTLEDFKRETDPFYLAQAIGTEFSRELRPVKRYLITSAQNATPVDTGFWAVLQYMQRHHARRGGCETLVIPTRYKNPTSVWTGSQKNAEYWAKEVQPLLWNVRHQLNQNLELLADMPIQPTMAQPLNGVDAVTKSRSCIVGHAKVHTKTVATPANRMAKLLMTTGSCTVANYSTSRVGKLGEFHHSLSALLVEVVDRKRFHMRRLFWDAKTKSVTDFGTRYFADRHEKAPRALAVAMGDWHEGFTDPAVVECTFGDGGIIERTDPEYIVWHDTDDGYPVNHHHGKNPFNRLAKRASGLDDARAALNRAIDSVRLRSAGRKALVIGSNHDDFLSKWIIEQDWKADPVNAEFYLETALAMVRGTKMGPSGVEYPSAVPYWFEKAGIPGVQMVRESFVLGNVELGMHGHQGPNGARGSIKNLRRIGLKSIIGHSHSPGEDEGCVQVGTSTRLRLEYNHGPSAWLQAHCLLNADGHRQLLFIIDGKCAL